MKYIGENAIKKLISLIKGDLATKQPTITASGLLKGDGAGTVTAAETQEATLVDVPNGLLKGDGTTISAAVAETDYMVPPTGGITGQVLKKTETGTEWADVSFKPAGKSYLTFSSPNSFTLKVNDTTKHWNGTLEYFSSNRTWTVWDGTTILSSVDNDGEYVLYLRGTGNTVITGSNQNYRWVLTGSNITCIGNIENLLDYATVTAGNHPTMADFCYSSMFQGCASLTQAPALPATTLADSCYSDMFQGCASLTQAPALPATTLARYCYNGMFQGCTALTQAPALPATTLAIYCYSGMFWGCTSLIQAPALPATTLADNCYNYMFEGCASLTQAPALPATTLADNCYNYMFEGCTSLTQAPALPATTLAQYCYYAMFQGCASLTQAPALPATTLADSCYSDMFQGCTSLTQAPALPATTLANGCYNGMFEGCTSLTQAPDLPATTLEPYCYSRMFYGCTALTQAPALPATTLAIYCYQYMFYGCTSLKLSSTQTDEYMQEYRIPSSGTGTTATDALTDMFTSTGGTFTGTPEINMTYYLSSDNMIVRETEIATLNGYVGAIAAPASHVEDTTVHVTADEKSAWNESILIKNTVIQLPTSSNWRSIAYGNGRFVAVSDTSNNAAYSDDGITWTALTLPVSGSWIVTYGNGRFVAVAYYSNNAAYSDDGITWTASILPVSSTWRSIAYGNGRFVAVTQDASMAAYSDDGITWITSTLPVSGSWSVTYGNSRFVAVARNSTAAAYSDDGGATWTASTLPDSSQWQYVAYGNGRFVTLAAYSDIEAAYSDDGITWTASTLPVSSAWRSIAYGNGRFVAVSYGSNNIVYSDDGINWTAATLPVSGYWYSVAYGNSKFVTAIYGGVTTFYSYDGITWSNTKPSLQTVSGTDVTDDTKVILGISDKQDKLPVDVEILETICENIEITDANNTYTFPTAITIDSDGLYYISYSYYENDTFSLINSGYLFSKPETIDDVLSVRWLSSSATNSITMTAANIVDTWVGTSGKSIISIYKVNVTVNDEMKKAALLREGCNNTASGSYSHAEGSRNTVSGNYSHVEGTKNTASGNFSHAEGIYNTASNYASHAEGRKSTASGDASHAEGRQNTASGNNSHAEGDTNTASGVSSHVEGFTNTASGVCSHAEGCCTEAFGYATHVQGRYNIIQSDIRTDFYGPYCHIVGNGLSDTKRSNAHTLDWNGNAWFAGTLEGTALILKSSTSNSTKRFKITVDDSGNLTATAII